MFLALKEQESWHVFQTVSSWHQRTYQWIRMPLLRKVCVTDAYHHSGRQLGSTLQRCYALSWNDSLKVSDTEQMMPVCCIPHCKYVTAWADAKKRVHWVVQRRGLGCKDLVRHSTTRNQRNLLWSKRATMPHISYLLISTQCWPLGYFS